MIHRIAIIALALALAGCNARRGGNAQADAPPDEGPIGYVMMQLPVSAPRDQPLPIVVCLHGMDSQPEVYPDDGIAHLQKERNMVVVTPSAPIGRRVDSKVSRYDWSDDIEENFARIEEALEEATRNLSNHKLRTDGIVLIGYSQGAYAALGLAYAHPERFAGAIAVSPGSLVNRPLPPLPSPLLSKRGFILCYGDQDDRNYIRQGRERIDAARNAGSKVQIKIYPKAGHLVPDDLDVMLIRWYDFIHKANS